jgi:ribose transport system ATP-binding protein
MPGANPRTNFGVISRSAWLEGARRILRDLEVDIVPRIPISHLSPGQQHVMEIAKGASRELRLIILDEPTSSLTIGEARHVFRVIRRLSA